MSRTTFILKTMNVIFWIIFIGLCIKTGALLISFFVSLFVNPAGAKNLYLGLNLFDLYTFSKVHFVFLTSLLILFTGLKAYIAYLVVKIFLKFNFTRPFHSNTTLLISKISYVALGAGILGIVASGYSDTLMKKGISISQDWGSNEFLFLSGIIFIIVQIFKKGTELQRESELIV